MPNEQLDLSLVLDWATQHKYLHVLDGCLVELQRLNLEPKGLFVHRFNIHSLAHLASKVIDENDLDGTKLWVQGLLSEFQAVVCF